MKTKFTKGKWKCITTSSEEHNRINIVSLNIDTPAQICEINRFGFGTDWIIESEANAKLIAAAPDLLEACNKAFNLCDKLQMPTEFELADLKVDLKQAIKKATE